MIFVMTALPLVTFLIIFYDIVLIIYNRCRLGLFLYITYDPFMIHVGLHLTL